MCESTGFVNRRVVVIDDYEQIHEDFKKILAGSTGSNELAEDEALLFGESETEMPTATFRVDSAYQGQEGVEKIRESRESDAPYAVAFVDMRMPPGWDGLETIEHIWKVDSEIQVVICTAYSDYSWKEITDRLGSSDRLLVLKKPFENIEVFQLASALTQKWSLARQARLRMSDLERAVDERTSNLQEVNEKLQQQISQRRQAEETLRQQNEVLGNIITNIPHYVFWMNRDAVYQGCNQNFADLVGVGAPENVVGKTAGDLFPDCDGADALRKRDLCLMETGESELDHDEERRLPDGSEMALLTSRVPLRDQDGTVVGLLGIYFDITERRRVERERARLAAGIEQSSEMIVITDPDGSIRYVNPAFERVTGYSREEVVGKNPRVLKSGKHDEEFYRDLWTTIRRGEVWRGRFINRKKDGTLYHEETSISPVRDASGEIISYASVKRDITKEYTLETQLRQAQKLEAIGQLAAGIAHEINTPTQYVGDNIRFLKDTFGDLSALLHAYGELAVEVRKGGAYAEALADLESEIQRLDLEFLREETPRAIEQAMEGVERVAEIVGAMKTFSHPGSGEKTPLDLNKAIQSTVTVSRNRWKYVADLETDLEGDLPAVPCYPGEFNQVILNLIVNAADAIAESKGGETDAKGAITVRTRSDGDQVEIRVIDNGPGVPEKIRDRIFEPFFTTKEVGAGTGQGLAICYDAVVKKLGGELTLNNGNGSGAEFVVRIPARSD